jgi:molybdenum cofactor cytidylyltransferase
VRAVSAIIPAAGLSSRFGGPNKLLQPWGDSTIIGTVVQALLPFGLPIIVVTGRDAEQVAQASHPGISVFNDRYQDGLGTSIAKGIAASPPSEGFLIALGDMPNLQPAVIERLLAEFENAPLGAILAPVYQADPTRPGHPVLFDASYRSALEALEGDEGARSILQANRDRLQLIQVRGHLEDIDSPS